MTGKLTNNWAAKYQARRDRYWPGVEQYFSRLPAHLFRQGMLLKNNLATFYADTGQFKDILRREHDFPLLYLHFWLLDDFCVPDTAERADFEKHLFLAMVFTFAAVYTRETILDEGANFDNGYLFLDQALTQQADYHLAQACPGQSPFWDYHRAFWHEAAEAALWQLPLQPAQRNGQDEVELWPIAGKLAFSKIPVAATAIRAGQQASLTPLCTMMDQLNLVCQVMRDILNIRRDISRRHYTYPIARTIWEAGLDPRQPLIPEQILGALVLTGVVEKIGQECLSRLEHCRAVSKKVQLPTFTAYLATLENWLNELTTLFSVKPESSPPTRPLIERKPPKTLFAPPDDTLQTVIKMAEGYLLSDLTFKESWEVQRRGLFGLPEVTARAFPSGLIVEILGRHGHDMAGAINTIFEALQANGFRYYDDTPMPPDADDVGLLLRLYPYSGQPEKHCQILQKPLAWLNDNIQESGQIPVWLTQHEAKNREELPFVSLWGKSCAAVEANVLLGLIDFDWAGCFKIIEKSALNLLERLAAAGLNAAFHYVPLYTLWSAFELVAKLSARPLPGAWPDKLAAAVRTLAGQVAVETKRPGLTPQDAAFLTLIYLSPGLPASVKPAFNPGWISLMCKSQRYDGSWGGEPLFGTPTRGEVASWYASRPVTTAFCYHALHTYLRSLR